MDPIPIAAATVNSAGILCNRSPGADTRVYLRNASPEKIATPTSRPADNLYPAAPDCKALQVAQASACATSRHELPRQSPPVFVPPASCRLFCRSHRAAGSASTRPRSFHARQKNNPAPLPKPPRLAKLVRKSLRRPRLRLLRFLFPVPRRSARLERMQKPSRSLGNFVHRSLKRSLVGLRRLPKAANFPHKLQRRIANFFLRNRRLKIKKNLDVPAHARSPQSYKSHSPEDREPVPQYAERLLFVCPPAHASLSRLNGAKYDVATSAKQ